MVGDKHLDIILDSQYLVLKGTGPDVDSTTLSGHVTLCLTEATPLKEITLQFKGRVKVDFGSYTYPICNHDWSFLQGDKKHSHTLKAGRHLFPFHFEISGSLPSTMSTSSSGGASVAYTLSTLATRPGFSHNFQTVVPVYILRSITPEALEYQQTLEIENTWPGKLMYSITLPHKAWAAGDTLAAIIKLSPLAKGISLQGIVSSLSETAKISARNGAHENTRVVASVAHEIVDHRAIEVDSNSIPAAGSSNASGTAVAHFTSPPSSRPSSPHSGHLSTRHHSHRHYHPPPHQQEQQEGEDLGLDTNDVVTCVTLSIPPFSVCPHFFPALAPASASLLPSPHIISPSHSQPSSGTILSFINANHTSPATPPRSTSPTNHHVPLPFSANSMVPHPTNSSLAPLQITVTPSHTLEPIIISHRIKWTIILRNKDGHISELRCSLPVIILDGAFLGESRGVTMRARRLLLRASGLGSYLNRSGGQASESEDEATGVEESMEADRELPSYPAHVRDRVANMYFPEAVTTRVSNPWVGTADTINPVILTVPYSDSPDRLSVPHTQPHSRASRSGHSTPAIQQVHMTSHLPLTPDSGGSEPLDWINSELVLSLSLDQGALRRIGGPVPSVGEQQQSQQPQPHRHQHQPLPQTHNHGQQQSRTWRWGSRVGSRAGSRTGSRAASPEGNALPSATTINSDNSPTSIPEGITSADGSPMFASGSSSGSGVASPFQNLFKATLKPFSTFTGHHGHGHRFTQPHSHSTISVVGLHSMSTAGTASDLIIASASSSDRPLALNPEPSQISTLSHALFGASSISSSTLALQNGTDAFISASASASSQPLAAIATFDMTHNPVPSLSPLSDPVLESNGAYSFPAASPSIFVSPLPSTHEADSQDTCERLCRVFSVVPDYSIASRGFIGGVPPLSSMRGLPSYEEAEAQRRERET